MLDAAREYAERDWRVLSLHHPHNQGCSCGKPECTPIGKHPRTRKGLSDATTDESHIRAWWAKSPDANIGILTGSPSGLLVVDSDNRDGINGSGNLAELAANFWGMPETPTAITGCGEHLYFRHPGVPVKNSSGKLADGVDIRADGGYVVAPPSLHADGERYDWKNPGRPLAEVPGWLLDKLTEPKKNAAARHDVDQDPPSVALAVSETLVINEGSRNDKLYRIGCALRGQHGWQRTEIVAHCWNPTYSRANRR
jgi:putative DNA primase/helicase